MVGNHEVGHKVEFNKYMRNRHDFNIFENDPAASEKLFYEWRAAWTPPEVEAMAQGGVRDEINVGSLWKDKSK